MKQPDIFERIALTFCRLLNRESTERPRFLIEPLPGSAWGAAVYLGEPPKPFTEHYARKQIIKAEGLPESPGHFWRAAVASSAGEALEELDRVLREGLYLRINGDLAIWDQATGKPWPGVAPVPRIEARPDEPDPAERDTRKRLPPPR